MLILIGWPLVFNKKKPQQDNTSQSVSQPTGATTQAPAVSLGDRAKTDLKIEPSKATAREDIYTVENDFIRVEISSMGGKIKQAAFKKYKDDKNNILRFFGNETERQGALQIAGLENANFGLVSKRTDSLSLLYNGKSSKIQINYSLNNSDPYVLRSEIKIPDSDKLKFKIVAAPSKDQNQYSFSSDPQTRNRDYLVYSQEKIERMPIKAKDGVKTLAFENKVNWIGISDRYFLFSILPSEGSFLSEVVADKKNVDGTYSTEFDILPKDGIYSYSIYIGPKDVSYLRKADPTLSESIDYGWLAVISVPMLELMKFFYKIIPNYGVAILLLTLLVRLIMYPLQHKSMKSMKKMQE
jgi:YidC/Oxa1 family membrane protein insertase